MNSLNSELALTLILTCRSQEVDSDSKLYSMYNTETNVHIVFNMEQMPQKKETHLTQFKILTETVRFFHWSFRY